MNKTDSDLELGRSAFQRAAKKGLETAVGDGLTISRNWLHWAFQREAYEEAEQAYGYAYKAGERLFRIQLLREQKESFLKESQGLAAHGAYAMVKVGEGSGVRGEGNQEDTPKGLHITAQGQRSATLGSGMGSGLGSVLQNAAIIIERGQARLLSEALGLDRADLGNLEGTEHAPLAAVYGESVARHQALNRQLGESDPEDKDGRDAILIELKQARVKMDQTIEAIRQIKGYEDFLSAPDFSEIQDAAKDHPLVYVMATSAGGLGLVVRQTCEVSKTSQVLVTPIWLPELTEKALRETIQGPDEEKEWGGYLGAYFNWQRSPNDDTAARDAWFSAMDNTTKWLWDAVMGPLAEGLKCHLGTPNEVGRITLIPVGRLALLPLHAAWTEAPDTPTGRRYALDDLLITYAPNARGLNKARNLANRLFPDRLLAVDEPKPVSGSPLPNSEYEVESIAAAFAEHDRQILRHEKATREAVQKALKESPSVLHFSCHGKADFFNPLDSGLAMGHDEILSVKELMAMRLGIRLTTLSACETGIPGMELPDEIVSLPAGLMQAGSAGVVSSLWSVYDLSTAMLMARFYELWRNKGLEPHEALRQAQIWMRDTSSKEKAEYFKQESDPDTGASRLTRSVGRQLGIKAQLKDPDFYQHPAHWAAFQYTGC